MDFEDLREPSITSILLIGKLTFSAKVLISKLAIIIDGGGGGKDSVATAGGKDVAKLDEALNQSLKIIKNILDE